MAENNMFVFIDDTTNQLNSIKNLMDEQFVKLQGKTQSVVDEIIINEINPTINNMLSSIRKSCVDSLKAMYKQYQKAAALLQPIQNSEPSDLSKVISFCKDVKNFLVEAFSTFSLFFVELAQKLVDLNTAIMSIVAYTPPESEGLNFDKLDIRMEPITMQDITG